MEISSRGRKTMSPIDPPPKPHQSTPAIDHKPQTSPSTYQQQPYYFTIILEIILAYPFAIDSPAILDLLSR